MKLFAPTIKDAYKIGHKDQYAPGTQYVYSNLTARSGKHSNIKGGKGIYFIGLQYVMKAVLIECWNDTFFSQPKDVVVAKYERRVSNVLGYKVSSEHIADLHDLGYLPVEIRALPEGSFVPYRVPMMTIVNTHPDFFWVTNMLETMLSAETWGILTSATTYAEYRRKFIEYAHLTGGDLSLVPFQAHDFSYRGMFGKEAGALSAFAVLAAGGCGTDTLPAIDIAEDYYGADSDLELIGCSVNATEHSVMCSNGKDNEIGTFKRLINKVYPEGILAIVSDTWDFWQVVTEFLPSLKDDIMARNGKVVIRPDSGDPVDIICGYTSSGIDYADTIYTGSYTEFTPQVVNIKGTYHPYIGIHGDRAVDTSIILQDCEVKGLIECLWDTFGGTVNEKGFKVLDEHIGAIYGDSITLERQEQILQRLKEKRFCSSNIVLGVGSYTYQHVTRDTHGMAIKATWVQINGKGVEIFKDPKTDDGIKKSAKGLLMVSSYNDGERLTLVDQVTPKQARTGALVPVFKDGKLLKEYTLAEVRKRATRDYA